MEYQRDAEYPKIQQNQPSRPWRNYIRRLGFWIYCFTIYSGAAGMAGYGLLHNWEFGTPVSQNERFQYHKLSAKEMKRVASLSRKRESNFLSR